MLTDIVDAILEITPFPMSDLGRLCMPFIMTYYAKLRSFVSILLRFNLRLTRPVGPTGATNDQCNNVPFLNNMTVFTLRPFPDFA